MMIATERKTGLEKGIFRAFRLTRAERFAPKGPLMDELMDDWLAEVRTRVKPTTYSTYRNVAERRISPAIGMIPVDRLTEEDITDFMTTLGEESSGLSDATLRITACVLRGTLNFGRDRGLDIPPDACRVTKRQQKPCVSVLSEEERAQLLTALGPCPDGKDLGILLSLKTGLRVGEVCALKWEDIEFENNVLCVKRTVQRIRTPEGSTKLYFGDPKSADSRREVPLPPSLVAVLHARRRADNCFIVSGHADRTVEPRTMQRHFKTVLRHADMRDLNFHALRHTFATRCVERGFDVKSLSMVLGHADVKTTMNIYVHPSAERLQNMMAEVD